MRYVLALVLLFTASARAQAPAVIASIPDITAGNEHIETVTLSLRSTASTPQHVRITSIVVGTRAARVVRVTQHHRPVDVIELAPGAHAAVRLTIRTTMDTLLPRGGAIADVRLEAESGTAHARFRMTPPERCLRCTDR